MCKCPICGSVQLESLFSMQEIPTFVNVLATTIKKATSAQVGNQDLVLCSYCGFVFNKSFEPDKVEYAEGYHIDRKGSSAYRNHIENTILQIQQAVELKNKTILEVGCGTGEFLKALHDKNLENCTLIGVDPSLSSRYEDGVRFDGDFFDEKYLNNFDTTEIDLLVSRHMIEHIQNLNTMFKCFNKSLSDGGGYIYLETPRLDWILENSIFFDFSYEHCSYFTDDFIKRFLSASGFEIISYKLSYQKQYFSICAKCGGTVKLIEPVSQEEKEKIKKAFLKLQNNFEDCKTNYVPSQNDCVWGCSGKGVIWLNLLDKAGISKVVDIDEYKQNKFVLKTGHRINRPEELLSLGIKRIIVMNELYIDEVKNKVNEIYGNQEVPLVVAAKDFV